MTDWRDYDEAWDRAEAYGESVGDNVYGDWMQSDTVVQDLRDALAQLDLETPGLTHIRELRELLGDLSADDPCKGRCETGDDQPAAERTAA